MMLMLMDPNHIDVLYHLLLFVDVALRLSMMTLSMLMLLLLVYDYWVLKYDEIVPILIRTTKCINQSKLVAGRESFNTGMTRAGNGTATVDGRNDGSRRADAAKRMIGPLLLVSVVARVTTFDEPMFVVGPTDGVGPTDDEGSGGGGTIVAVDVVDLPLALRAPTPPIFVVVVAVLVVLDRAVGDRDRECRPRDCGDNDDVDEPIE
jgi:hypothetical protein